MNVLSFIILDLIVACSFRKGHGAANFAGPAPSGSVIANFEGAINATTLTCNVTNEGFQIQTFWSVGNFLGVPGIRSLGAISGQNLLVIGGGSILNELTVTNWTSEADGVIVFCGTGSEPTQANVTLRLYRTPNLQDNFLLNIQEGDFNVPVDLLLEPAAFPEPSTFEWRKNDQPLRQNGITTTYSSVIFDSIVQSDAGNYTVTATNFVLDASQPVGSDAGSFSLDVLYPPSFMSHGPTERYVLLGDPLSIVCGTGLDSNPQATITWIASDTSRITMNMGRYFLNNGPEIVRLNFSNTIMSDNGVWTCEVLVISSRYIVSGGQLVVQDSALIGSITQNIQLTVIATPGAPSVPAVENIGATWAQICWDPPMMADSPISRYQIIGREVSGAGIVVENTTTNATFFNITGLLPATTYSFTVVAISEGGNVIATSPESMAIQDTTGVMVPSLMCNDPEFSMGGITASWSYIHTGGQDLTSVLVSYTLEEGGLPSTPIPVMNTDPTITSINVPRQTAGTRYTFNITAVNSIGSSYILCGPTLLSAGIPLTPSIGNLFAGSVATEIKLEIKTLASGEGSGFKFNIIPVRSGMEEPRQMFMNDTYQSGVFVTLIVGDLTEGGTYVFSATAENNYGESGIANSPAIVIGELPSPSVGPPQPTQEQQGSSNVGAIIGGVVGVLLLVVIIIIIIAIVAISLHLRYNKGHSKRASNVKIEIPIYDEPDNFRRNTVNASDIELKDCPAYEKVQKESHIKLEQCPAYGELRSRS